ncbi:helix-turn-helix transcriptional regulator [Serratia bockelmannii]|uniref:helix-turn-helix transcriptional regulator n=1 Tax=Serratia bockelmannii TaxID=2703793 RepID=UPI0023628012|nr:LuxR C-terminal-related transcriptional regulator [Serratia bockelmannii]
MQNDTECVFLRGLDDRRVASIGEGINKLFNFVILDDDRFFVHELILLLHQYFMSIQIKIKITELTLPSEADLVFIGPRIHLAPSYLSGWISRCPRIIQVRDSGCHRELPIRGMLGIKGEIDRHAGRQSVLQEVTRVLRFTAIDAKASYCAEPLSWRERQILNCLLAGESIGQIAWRLTLSQKTVSGYKCCAMRKLGFTRNIELYRWLLAGGLKYEIESSN